MSSASQVLRGAILTARSAAMLGLLIAAAAAFVGLQVSRPPAEVGVDAAAHRFSGARAFETVEALAAEARPVGSTGHRDARQFVADELAELGLEVRIQDATVVRRRGSGRIEAARVQNVLGRRAGRGVKGAVLLLAHYDTRPQTPGAADDAVGVATILETLRALGKGSLSERDVLVAVTDGEEYGLFGAQAFVEKSSWIDEVDFLINIEARGNRGPSMMFETSAGNLELVSLFADQAPFPFGNSLSYEVYRRMPNDSDFSAFRATSVAGLNFALIGNHPAYHTLLDSPDRLDRRSLQHHGSNVLALTRFLSDLTSFSRSGEDGVYFNVSPTRMIVYPASVARVLGVGLLVMAAVALFRSRTAAVWTPGGLLAGALLVVVALLAGYAVGTLFWIALQRVAPVLLEAPHGRPYRTLWFGGSIALMVSAFIVSSVRRMSVSGRPLELLAGALVVWTLLATALAFWIPGASYLLTWPAASGWIGWWIVARAGNDRFVSGVQIVTALGAAVGVLLFVPMLVLFLEALTLSGAGIPAALFGLLLTLLIPQLTILGRIDRVAFALFGVALCLTLVAAASSGRSDLRPKPNSLFHVASDEGSHWYSTDSEPDPWTSEFLGSDPERLPASAGLAMGTRQVIRAPAEDGDLSDPFLESADERVGVGRQISVRAAAGNGGQILYVRMRSKAAIRSLEVGAEDIDVASTVDDLRMTLIGSSSENDPWKIRIELEGDAGLEFEILEQRFGLPKAGGRTVSRPADFIPSSSWRTDSTYIHRRFVL